MLNSESYGDSDDDTLLIAATQNAEHQAVDDFEPSSRPAKRQRVEGPAQGITSGASVAESELLDDSALLEGDLIEEENCLNKRKHLLYAPRIRASLDCVVLTQTQTVPASQPWEIRGPIWRRPEPKTPEKKNGIAAYFTNGPKQAPLPTTEPSKSLAQIIAAQRKETSRVEAITTLEYVETFGYKDDLS
jgi:hypothetical protein